LLLRVKHSASFDSAATLHSAPVGSLHPAHLLKAMPTTDRQASRTICRIAGEVGVGEHEGEASTGA
jgi:hypothetical protein